MLQLISRVLMEEVQANLTRCLLPFYLVLLETATDVAAAAAAVTLVVA